MKTSVSSYSFSQLLGSGECTQLDLIAKAKAMGFDGIEFTDLQPPEGTSEKEYASLLAQESEKYALPIVSYTIGAELLSCDSLQGEIERLCTKAEVAKLLGARLMRHDATGGYRDSRKGYMSFEQALPTIIEGCRAVTHYADGLGISTMVENHGFFCQESTRVERIITGVASENFGVLLDFGNFACADEPSVEAVGRLASFAKHIHAKDFHIKSGNGINPGSGFFMSRGGNYLRGAIIGHGDIPVLQCINAVKAAGYDGYISIEFEGIENAEKGIAIGLENLKKML